MANKPRKLKHKQKVSKFREEKRRRDVPLFSKQKYFHS